MIINYLNNNANTVRVSGKGGYLLRWVPLLGGPAAGGDVKWIMDITYILKKGPPLLTW